VTERRFSRVLLVGFMGAGKTRVGRELAQRLGWRFMDFDDVVEAEFGLSIPDIFTEYGERRFREVERCVAGRLLGEDRVVLASGGGWAAQPGHLDAVPAGTTTVWLEVSAQEAVRRASVEPNRRPLLGGSDAADTARSLLEARAPFYAAANYRVDTERSTVEDVSARIFGILAGNDIDKEAE